MKMIRISILVGICTIILSLSAVSLIHGQPVFDMWNGKWFVLNIKFKGYAFDIPEIIPDREKRVAYLHLGTWDDWNYNFPAPGTFIRLFDDMRGWEDVPLTVTIHGGLEWDFLCWVLEENPPDISYMFAIRVRGKEDQQNPGEVKKATLKSLGGCYWGETDRVWSAGKMDLKGKMVPESEVPPVGP